MRAARHLPGCCFQYFGDSDVIGATPCGTRRGSVLSPFPLSPTPSAVDTRSLYQLAMFCSRLRINFQSYTSMQISNLMSLKLVSTHRALQAMLIRLWSCLSTTIPTPQDRFSPNIVVLTVSCEHPSHSLAIMEDHKTRSHFSSHPSQVHGIPAGDANIFSTPAALSGRCSGAICRTFGIGAVRSHRSSRPFYTSRSFHATG